MRTPAESNSYLMIVWPCSTIGTMKGVCHCCFAFAFVFCVPVPYIRLITFFIRPMNSRIVVSQCLREPSWFSGPTPSSNPGFFWPILSSVAILTLPCLNMVHDAVAGKPPSSGQSRSLSQCAWVPSYRTLHHRCRRSCWGARGTQSGSRAAGWGSWGWGMSTRIQYRLPSTITHVSYHLCPRPGFF